MSWAVYGIQNHSRVPEEVYSNRRVSECRNKLFVRVLLEGILKLVSFFKEASCHLIFVVIKIKNMKTTSAYTESTDLNLQAIKKILVYSRDTALEVVFLG
jgi:hypothetical protein